MVRHSSETREGPPEIVKHTTLRKEVASLLVSTGRSWQKDRVPRMAAALAYYMALALAPTLVIVLAAADFALGTRGTHNRFLSQIQGLVGSEGARLIQSAIQGQTWPSGIAATLFGVAALFFGATTVVIELKDSLNTIWRVPEDNRVCSHYHSLLKLIRERFLGFSLVLGAGLFLLGSLVVNVWVSAADSYLSSIVTPPVVLLRIGNGVFSLVVDAFLFAFVFKSLPNVSLKWGDVFIGAIATSSLFTAGKFLLAIYFGRTDFARIYGAAGSLVALLIWVYYSAQVFFLGAEFIRVYTLRFGSLAGHAPAVRKYAVRTKRT